MKKNPEAKPWPLIAAIVGLIAAIASLIVGIVLAVAWTNYFIQLGAM